jgi:hypothetical protein
LRSHPDANDNPDIPWSESTKGKAIIGAGLGKTSLDMHNRWDSERKTFVPMEKRAVDELRNIVPKRADKDQRR